jgi:hypothetical protein
VEGRQAAQLSEELVAAGAIVVANPLTGAHIGEALDKLSGLLRSGDRGGRKVGARERLRRFLGG